MNHVGPHAAKDSPESPPFDIEQLLRPEAYPHPVTGVTLRETHISWVLLTGSVAYKIKKPVSFDFLDASILERRRHFCEEELRLNRRLAPELYLDVVPIVRQAGQLVVGGGDQPIEYAVRMKQFAQDDELLNLLDERRVEVGEIMDLAERLAQFHADAPIVRFGGAEQQAQRVRDAVMGNLAQLVSSKLPVEVAGPLGRLIDWTHDAANALEDSLSSPTRDIRECHGDLHAGNIVRHGGHLLPFDCIEFNPDLRCIDAINDVAFLFMDLISHDRNDLAHALLSRYLEVSGDYAGTRVLRFYAVYRALVRARIDALSTEEVPSRSREFETRLKRRVAAALLLAQPAVPTLVLMHGVSGSGKSWLSERLVAALPAVRVRSDLERKRLASGLGEAKGLDIHSSEFNHRTYARLLECAESCLAAGITVIVDATFLEASDRELFRALATRMRAASVIVSCQANDSVLTGRIVARQSGNDASDADLAVLRRQLATLAPFDATEKDSILLADTGAQDVVERIAAAVRARS